MEETELINLVKGWQNKEAESTQILMGMAYCRIKELAVKHRNNMPDNANTLILSSSATDLAHDAYLRLLKVESQLPIETLREFYSYLNATVRNTFIDNYRKLVETRSRNPERTSLQSADSNFHVKNSIEQSDEFSSLSLSIDELGREHPRQAEVVQLRYYSERSNKEIARLLQVSLRTVENDLKFSKAWIKVKL